MDASANRLFLPVLFFILIAGAAYSQVHPLQGQGSELEAFPQAGVQGSEFQVPPQDTGLESFLFDYGIAIALIISYAIVALGFMGASIFSSRELEIWSRAELREVFMSTVYAALIVAFFPVFDALVNSFTPDQTYQEVFSSVIHSSVDQLVGLSQFTSFASLLNAISWSPAAYNTFFVSWTYSFYYAPQTAYSLVMVFASMFMPILITAIISITGQMLLLAFFEKTIHIFIGLALFLRAFTFTRRMGSTLLGIFLGGFLFFKLILVFEAAVYSQLSASGQLTGIDSSGSTSSEILLRDAGLNNLGISMDSTVSSASGLPSDIVNFFSLLNIPVYLWDFFNWLVDQCPSGFLRYICIAVCVSIFPVLGVVVWTFDVLWTIISLVYSVLTSVSAVLSLILSGPGLVGIQIGEAIASQIAMSADMFAYAFFMPFFNIVFVLSGMKALVEAFGGDESVVNMLTFI